MVCHQVTIRIELLLTLTTMSDKLFLWVEKYRPKKIDECILPDATRRIFQGFLEQGEIPNLLLAGTAGVGKTTVAKALCEELGTDCLVINGSDEGRFLDTVRNQQRSMLLQSLSPLQHPTRSLSSMRQTTPPLTCNYSYVPAWRVSKELQIHLHLQLQKQNHLSTALSMLCGGLLDCITGQTCACCRILW